MKEMKPDGLSDASRRDPAMLAAMAQAQQLQDKDVFDVNGIKLGRVTRALAEEGALLRLDVTLTPNARGILDAPQDVVGIPTAWIAGLKGHDIHLRKAGEEIVHPEEMDPHQRKVGAKDLPRKVR